MSAKGKALRTATGIALALAGTKSLSAENWGTEHSEVTAGPQYQKSKAICRRLGDFDPPRSDRPTPAQTKGLKGCDSEKLYYGEGAKPDYVKARQCAFIDDGADDQSLSGSTILMQIYANGLGVKRNLDVATAYACNIDGAPAESDGRVLHLQALKIKSGRFDYCDDITSGFAEGYCQAKSSRLAKVGREAQIHALVEKLPTQAKQLYPIMRRAFDAFVEAHGDGEVDLSGTARAAEEIQEQEKVRDQFLSDLARLKSGRWPQASTAEAKTSDAALNSSYREALMRASGKNTFSTVRPEDIRAVQRLWLAYRDLFVRFGEVASPGLRSDALLVRVTRFRIIQLDQLTG